MVLAPIILNMCCEYFLKILRIKHTSIAMSVNPLIRVYKSFGMLVGIHTTRVSLHEGTRAIIICHAHNFGKHLDILIPWALPMYLMVGVFTKQNNRYAGRATLASESDHGDRRPHIPQIEGRHYHDPQKFINSGQLTSGVELATACCLILLAFNGFVPSICICAPDMERRVRGRPAKSASAYA